MSLVSFTGSYTEAEPGIGRHGLGIARYVVHGRFSFSRMFYCSIVLVSDVERGTQLMLRWTCDEGIDTIQKVNDREHFCFRCNLTLKL